MIAKIKVYKPSLKADMSGEYELSFKVNQESVFGIKQVFPGLLKNDKPLQIEIDFAKKKRSLDQNALLWELLTIYAKELNGQRLNTTTEELYYKMLNKFGKDTLVMVPEGAEKTLKRVYKKVYIIDKVNVKNQTFSKCRCVLGSSTYDTKEMTDLIDGVLDEMSEAGIQTDEKILLENQWREYGSNL